MTNSTGLQSNTNAYYRELNNVVYKLENNVERMVYNFNLHVGDSIVNDPNISHSPLYVTNIDTIVLEDNKPRKRFKLNCEDEGREYYWVECIGGFPETFDEGICTISDADKLELRCFYEGSIQVYHNDTIENCLITSTEQIDSDSGIKINPNPTNGYLSITANDKINQIKVLNSYGQVLKMEKNISEVDISNLVRGVYFLEIVADGKKYIKKVVKI